MRDKIVKCKKCNSEMEMIDFGDDFEFLVCTKEHCEMMLTIQENEEYIWELDE